MARFEVHACTDVTGFGLVGHLAELDIVTAMQLAVKVISI
jgi:selenophosphate synthase